MYFTYLFFSLSSGKYLQEEKFVVWKIDYYYFFFISDEKQNKTGPCLILKIISMNYYIFQLNKFL